MTVDILELPTGSRKQVAARSSSKPLTALQVKNHKEGVLADTHPHSGLRLRANKNGSKTWFYRYKLADKLKQIKLGTWPGMELAEARAAFIEQRKLKESNQDPVRVSRQKKADLIKLDSEQARKAFTFGDMVEQYLTQRVEKDRKAKGALEVRRLLERDLGALASLPVECIESGDLHDHILKISSRAPDVARVFRGELARAWRYAINTGRTKIACLINTDTGGKLTQGKRERWLKESELRLLLPWMDNYSATVKDALLLTLYLGLRSGEVCKLRDEWLHQEADGWWLVIPKSEMKRGHSDHRVPLTGTALDVVESRKGAGVWFPNRAGGSIQQKVLGVEVYAHSGRSKSDTYSKYSVCPVTDWAPNDLRKTARSHLAALGCPFEVAESILHHKVPGVSGLYNQHSYDAEKRAWLAKLGELFKSFTAA